MEKEFSFDILGCSLFGVFSVRNRIYHVFREEKHTLY